MQPHEITGKALDFLAVLTDERESPLTDNQQHIREWADEAHNALKPLHEVMKTGLWIAAVSNDHGLDILYCGMSETTAREYLYRYVKKWWDDIAGQTYCFDHNEGDKEVPEDPPEDRMKAVEMYFWLHPDGERYELRSYQPEP